MKNENYTLLVSTKAHNAMNLREHIKLICVYTCGVEDF